MSARNPGGRIWLAHLTIVTRGILPLAFTLLSALPLWAGSASSAVAVKRIVTLASSFSRQPVPPYRQVRQACGQDALCAARLILASQGKQARLEKVTHPTTNSIRRVESLPSITRQHSPKNNVLRIRLERFGRKANTELLAATSHYKTVHKTTAKILEIDLRHNRGGNLKYMLRVAAWFTGAITQAIILKGNGNQAMLDIPKPPQRFNFAKIRLIVGKDTASSAEIFTALLRVHASAKVIGARTYGKNYLLRIIAVSHDWRLLIPSETVLVPGTTLKGGIIPDRPL